MKGAFEVKQKTFFLASQVLSFRHKKQASKNVADTTFKDIRNIFANAKFLFASVKRP